MSNIQGRVRIQTLDTLFQAGFLPDPQTIEGVIEDCVSKIHKNNWEKFDTVLNVNYDKQPMFKKLFSPKPEKVAYKHWKCNCRLIDMLHKSDYEHLREYYYQAQDIRKVLETLSVSKMSQGSFVMADKFTLMAVERVAKDVEYYEDLLNLVYEELDKID